VIPGVDYTQRFFEDVVEGEELPATSDLITYRRVIMNPAATWDFFPGHHDPEYARAQGQPTIFVNTMHLMGFVDRLVAEWGGPRTFLARRKVSLHRSVYAGDTMTGAGKVVAKRTGEQAGHRRALVDLDVTVDNQDGARCATAPVTVALPSRSDADEDRPWWPTPA
jgi:acyl dehydratase